MTPAVTSSYGGTGQPGRIMYGLLMERRAVDHNAAELAIPAMRRIFMLVPKIE
jgi:hypothetical protein